MNYKDFKNCLTLDDIYNILEYFNGAPIIKNNYIISKTICHSGHSHKLYYYDNSKLFKCYTECSESFDIFTLIDKIYKLKNKNIHYNEIVKLIKNILHKEFNNIIITDNEPNLIEEQIKLLKKQKEEVNNYQFIMYSTKILNALDNIVVKEWVEEGIDQWAQLKYNIRFLPLFGQIVIPHYDINNNLIGIRGRFLNDIDSNEYGKYRPVTICGLTYSHPLSLNLYGLNFNKTHIKQAKTAIIFEGEKSVMKYESYFGESNNISVACCGSSVSVHQINLLLSLGVQEIIIALDKQFTDKQNQEFDKYITNICKIAQKIINYCNVSVIFDNKNLLDYKDAPIDKGKDTFIKLFNSRINISEQIIKEVI